MNEFCSQHTSNAVTLYSTEVTMIYNFVLVITLQLTYFQQKCFIKNIFLCILH